MQRKKVSKKENVLAMKSEIPAGAAAPVLLAPSKLIAAVFCSVSKNGGRISSFSYNRGICVFSVSGCPSENVAGAHCCVASYKDNRFQFTLSAPVLKENMELCQEENDEVFVFSDYKESVKNVRNELFQLGANIQKELVSENEAEFEFYISEDFLYSALKISGMEAKALGWNEKSFSVEKSRKQNLVRIIFSRENEGRYSNSFSPVLLAANYAWLFKSEVSNASEQVKFVQKQPLLRNPVIKNSSLNIKLPEVL